MGFVALDLKCTSHHLLCCVKSLKCFSVVENTKMLPKNVVCDCSKKDYALKEIQLTRYPPDLVLLGKLFSFI